LDGRTDDEGGVDARGGYRRDVVVAGTCVGGTQDKYQVFIENCHIHVERIAAAIAGQPVHAKATEYAQPES